MSVKRYEVDYDLGKGRSTKTTLKLNDAEAKRLGLLKEKPSTKKAAPANKSRSASNKKG